MTSASVRIMILIIFFLQTSAIIDHLEGAGIGLEASILRQIMFILTIHDQHACVFDISALLMRFTESYWSGEYANSLGTG